MAKKITDKMRLDFLQRNKIEIHDRYHDPVDRWRVFSFPQKIDFRAPTIRQAIDAAIRARRKSK